MENTEPQLEETACTQTESEELIKSWLAEFTVLSYQEFLQTRFNTYVWEKLNNKKETLEFPESIEAYLAHRISEFYLLRKTKAGHELSHATAKELPLFLHQEAIVFPKNLAWTMIFTHEDKSIVRSPFFIKHSNYKMLNLKNEEKEKALVGCNL